MHFNQYLQLKLSSLSTLPISTHPSLPEISITEHGIFTLLSQINPQKACEPDESQDLTPMITHLFKQSLDISELCTTRVEIAYVTPIFKKDKRSEPSNYRPASLT